MEALRREAAKWQELEESKLFLETQVAQFQSAKQQEASRADTLAAQVMAAPHSAHKASAEPLSFPYPAQQRISRESVTIADLAVLLRALCNSAV